MNTPSKKTILIAIGLALAALTGITACGKKEDPPAAKAAATTSQPNKAEPVRPVRTITVAQGAVGDILYLPGEVKARFEQRYGFRVNGKIAQRLVDVGQAVKAGQTLAVMDSSDVLPSIAAQNAQVEAARTDMTLQQAELKRVQELSTKGFLSNAALDRQRAATDASVARLKAAQSQLASVQNGLNFQTLRADKAGIVVGVDAEAGSVVAAGQSVVRVAQVSEKEIQVSVPERSVKALREAKALNAVSDAVPGKLYNLQLRELAPNADSASRTYAAKLTILNADDALRWGMSSTVRIDLNQTQALVVPNTALYTRDSIVRVWVVDKATETVKPVDVKLGTSKDDGVVVTSGLKAGDIVVTAGSNLLQPGQKVRLLAEPVAQGAK
jgi:membrane fusion protein, multidrug efflux system